MGWYVVDARARRAGRAGRAWRSSPARRAGGGATAILTVLPALAASSRCAACPRPQRRPARSTGPLRRIVTLPPRGRDGGRAARCSSSTSGRSRTCPTGSRRSRSTSPVSDRRSRLPAAGDRVPRADLRTDRGAGRLAAARGRRSCSPRYGGARHHRRATAGARRRARARRGRHVRGLHRGPARRGGRRAHRPRRGERVLLQHLLRDRRGRRLRPGPRLGVDGWRGVVASSARALVVAGAASSRCGASPRFESPGGRGRVGAYALAAMTRRGIAKTTSSRRIISTVGSSLELDDVLAAVVRAALGRERRPRVLRLPRRRDAASGSSCAPRASRTRTSSAPSRSAAARASRGGRSSTVSRRSSASARSRTRGRRRCPSSRRTASSRSLAVPVLSRAGAEIGAITAHTEAPREFTDDEVAFLVTVARLVAGAIENARLYEETRRRVAELERLTAARRGDRTGDPPSRRSSRSSPVALASSSGRARATCTCSKAGTEELELQASDPSASEARTTLGLAELGPELARGGRATRLAVPLVAGDELVGLLVARDTAAIDLARAVASQAAVGVRKLQLIERLTERNLIKEFFDELAGGRVRGDLDGSRDAARLRSRPAPRRPRRCACERRARARR